MIKRGAIPRRAATEVVQRRDVPNGNRNLRATRRDRGFGTARQHQSPALPRTVEDTGLDFLFLVELVAKVLFVRGQISLAELSAHLKLPATVLETLLAFMRTERLCEVARRGGNDGDVTYQLTDAGRQRAAGYLARSQYAGVAPVGLKAYADAIEAQSVVGLRVTRNDVDRTFAGVVTKPGVLDQVGAAMNPVARSSSMARQAREDIPLRKPGGLLPGNIAVPHAIVVDNEVIQVFDPLVHHRSRRGRAGGRA